MARRKVTEVEGGGPYIPQLSGQEEYDGVDCSRITEIFTKYEMLVDTLDKRAFRDQIEKEWEHRNKKWDTLRQKYKFLKLDTDLRIGKITYQQHYRAKHGGKEFEERAVRELRKGTSIESLDPRVLVRGRYEILDTDGGSKRTVFLLEQFKEIEDVTVAGEAKVA